MEKAKKQWGKIDVEGHKIINNLIAEDKERTVWPEIMEPKTRKKGTKMTRVSYNTKTKKIHSPRKSSTSRRTDHVTHSRLLHLLLFPPNKNEYVVIDAPNRHEPNAKFVITAAFCIGFERET